MSAESSPAEPAPAYPEVRVTVRSPNRWAVAAAVRQALRRAGTDRVDIDRFVREAMAADTPEHLRDVCRRWVRLQA